MITKIKWTLARQDGIPMEASIPTKLASENHMPPKTRNGAKLQGWQREDSLAVSLYLKTVRKLSVP